jgi:histidine triad (HIT) family protein
MMNKLARVLFSLAKTQVAGMVVRSCFSHWSFLLPVKRLYETPFVLAFYHPKPAYPHHVVIVPKKAIPNLLVLRRYPDYATAILGAAREIAFALHWERGTSVLCANGGPRQEVQQVHFHLFCGNVPAREPLSEAKGKIVYSNEVMQAVCYPQSDGRLHIALMSQCSLSADGGPTSDVPFVAFLQSLPSLDQQLRLVQRGYTFLIDHSESEDGVNLIGYITTGSAKKENHG